MWVEFCMSFVTPKLAAELGRLRSARPKVGRFVAFQKMCSTEEACSYNLPTMRAELKELFSSNTRPG